jgi:hypothetical protein
MLLQIVVVCGWHFFFGRQHPSDVALFEREDALPIVLHADHRPALTLRLVV